MESCDRPQLESTLAEIFSRHPSSLQLVLVCGDFHVPQRCADIPEQFRSILVRYAAALFLVDTISRRRGDVPLALAAGPFAHGD